MWKEKKVFTLHIAVVFTLHTYISNMLKEKSLYITYGYYITYTWQMKN
jgi:hypothetical protein